MLKIERTVIQSCASEPDATRLLHAITGAARAFNLTVAGIGVENHAVEQTLREAGCNIAQGWLYGPAMPATTIMRLLEAKH
jgi:EAL domain-containing protein (putative c-di-GMP-specific phosphodiesterase class I)